jgi:hypothetical protein
MEFNYSNNIFLRDYKFLLLLLSIIKVKMPLMVPRHYTVQYKRTNPVRQV